MGVIRPSFQTFTLGGATLPLFAHHHNCGHPPDAMSERAVEMPLADLFLATTPRESVVEVGGVTPYYWPYRVLNVIDPGDKHPLVNIRASYLDIDCTGKDILSISTFEHIGAGECGQPLDPPLNARAFAKLFREARSFLVTVPGGYNPVMDQYLMQLNAAENHVNMRALVRVRDNEWEQRSTITPADLRYEYGAYFLFVLTRRSFIERQIR